MTLVGLLVGLGIYVHSTQAAVAEREELRLIEERLRADYEQVGEAARAAAARRIRLDDDPESLLVELDRAGISPEQAGERAVPPADEDVR